MPTVSPSSPAEIGDSCDRAIVVCVEVNEPCCGGDDRLLESPDTAVAVDEKEQAGMCDERCRVDDDSAEARRVLAPGVPLVGSE